MKKFLIYLLFIIPFTAGCRAVYQIREPGPDEIKKQGLVVAGLVVLDPTSSEFLSEDKGKTYPVSPTETVFAQIVSINNKRKDIKIKLINREEPKRVSREKSRIFYDTSTLFIDPYLVFRNDEDRFLTLYQTAYYIPCGPSCSRKNILTLSPFAAQKVLTVKSRPGTIEFAGIYIIRETLLKKGVLGVGEKKGVELVEGLDIIKSRKDIKLKARFFGEEEQTLKGAEIHFLKQFIGQQKDGYWRKIAEKKLNFLVK